MQKPSSWATKADVEAAREALKADIAALHADLRAVQALLTELHDRRPWWRRLFTAGAAVVAVMGVSIEVRAYQITTVMAFKDGKSLYEQCAEPTSIANCLGYVQGVSDAMSAGRAIGPHALCPPRGVTEGQERDVVLQFLTRHPELLEYAASYLVARALAEVFRCR